MPISADEYRRLIGNFATGVTVVSTAAEGRLHAFTANSLTSVSLDPMLLLVCVDKGATAHGELKNAAKFGVSILSEAQEEISNLFAKSAEPEADRLRGVDFRLGESGAPLIEGAIASIECEVSDLLDGGDHTIFIGTVIGGAIRQESAPLLFFRGGYRRLRD